MSGSDLFTGTLDLLILRMLRDGDRHGYDVGRILRRVSEGVLDVGEGVLYPALHRLEARGLLASRWGPSDTGRRARYYELTRRGAEVLDSRTRDWDGFSAAIQSVLDMPGEEPVS
jgi:transcriptional regulator